ncbi:uncharacterized abhydrolase domain-containing protein [Drosophila madeirensis]|uniref:Uncharacterized abhydrolase domain-containing protein n=1 Tax=Drosophila madeirensis TaxID=30013 RepID=A0AAU9G479_DROMD
MRRRRGRRGSVEQKRRRLWQPPPSQSEEEEEPQEHNQQQHQQQQHQQPGSGWQGPQGAVIGPFVSQEVRTAVRGGMVWHHQTLHITWASGPAPDPEEARVWE